MRLFTGLDLPAEVAGRLSGLVEQLRPAARIGWSPAENLHITTKFIGEWPEDRLAELQAPLASLPGRPALEIRVGGLGFFPNAKSPRVFWCGVQADGLAQLAADTDAAAAGLGIEAEKRAYSPHLTLARIKERVNMGPLREKIEKLGAAEMGTFTARSFFLYRSQLRPTGSVYTKLAEFALSK